jgi:leucyl/phenylalanyl-tRNA--protein transferase
MCRNDQPKLQTLWYLVTRMRDPGLPTRFRPWLLLAGAEPCWPDPNLADADEGLVAVGGDLEPYRLLSAYAAGIFPWFDDRSPILWWSPEPRAVLSLQTLHISRSLRRSLQQAKFKVRVDQDFTGVIDGCSDRMEGTWITTEMRSAYVALHHSGHAHSFEVLCENRLVGGLYGVQLGGLFAAESMFHRATNASKIALVCAVTSLFAGGCSLFDVQFLTPHLASLGATLMPRRQYLEAVAVATKQAVPWRAVTEQLQVRFPMLCES